MTKLLPLMTLSLVATCFAADDLKIRVVEGDGALNSIALARAKEPVVLIENGEGEPVTGAVVNFILPASGAGAFFPGREQSLTVPRMTMAAR